MMASCWHEGMTRRHRAQMQFQHHTQIMTVPATPSHRTCTVVSGPKRRWQFLPSGSRTRMVAMPAVPAAGSSGSSAAFCCRRAAMLAAACSRRCSAASSSALRVAASSVNEPDGLLSELHAERCIDVGQARPHHVPAQTYTITAENHGRLLCPDFLACLQPMCFVAHAPHALGCC